MINGSFVTDLPKLSIYPPEKVQSFESIEVITLHLIALKSLKTLVAIN
ncbi:hypothetical protein COO91_03776 [Nostoc flagelliforme CCNUN1]|uniref:Uncharacterized protein n=1 Tax=Nostoc flagelliforme CCNUN1 TaxID=2038116 RepID=A0A2K8SQT3_9NOSO|nr:hypothetical protein COO91_03776 [Nostoc flagelliforme CCNUN1]